MFENIKKFAVEQVLWAEKNLRGKSGAEKKAAVVKKIDDFITLPSCLEWFDDIFIEKLVDKACEKLNAFAGHGFGEKEITKEQQQALATEIETPEVKKS